MFLEHAFDDGLPLIHSLFLRQVSHSSAATHIDSCITRPLLSVKSLAQWVLRAASSTSPLPVLKALSQPQGDATPLSKTPITRPKDASGVVVIYLIFSDSPSKANREGAREGTIFLFLTVDKKGFVSLLGSIHIQASFPLFECSPRQLTFHGAKPRFFSTPRPYLLRIIISILATNQPAPKSPPQFLGYHFCRALKSVFGFLKYSGPRQLVASRKILLDQDGYQITHIGQGAFATISRVLHKPTGDVRVMKRITFDKNGLAKYLVNNEVDTLKAMEGNHWFPRLLNHFSEGGQFVVTMVPLTISLVTTDIIASSRSLFIVVETYQLSWNTKDISAANSPNFTLLNSYVLLFFNPSSNTLKHHPASHRSWPSNRSISKASSIAISKLTTSSSTMPGTSSSPTSGSQKTSPPSRAAKPLSQAIHYGSRLARGTRTTSRFYLSAKIIHWGRRGRLGRSGTPHPRCLGRSSIPLEWIIGLWGLFIMNLSPAM